MKTMIDIPEEDLRELLRRTRARTKREAVLTAIEEYNRRSRMQELTSHLGKFEEFMTQKDLRKMREE